MIAHYYFDWKGHRDNVKKYGELIFQPKAKVLHFSSNFGGNHEIIKGDSCKFIYWNLRNTLIFYFKHLKFIDSFYKSVFRLKNLLIGSFNHKILVKSRPKMKISSRLKLFLSLFLGFIQGFAMGIGYKLGLVK